MSWREPSTVSIHSRSCNIAVVPFSFVLSVDHVAEEAQLQEHIAVLGIGIFCQHPGKTQWMLLSQQGQPFLYCCPVQHFCSLIAIGITNNGCSTRIKGIVERVVTGASRILRVTVELPTVRLNRRFTGGPIGRATFPCRTQEIRHLLWGNCYRFQGKTFRHVFLPFPLALPE